MPILINTVTFAKGETMDRHTLIRLEQGEKEMTVEDLFCTFNLHDSYLDEI